MTEDTKAETDRVGASNGTTVVAVTTVAVATGIVQNVKIQTSHSEPNATDAVNPKDTVEAVGEAMTAEADETTVGTKVEINKAVALNETTEVAVTTVAVATGIVQNVKIQTSHSEPNATDAVNPKDTVEAVDEAMTGEADETTVEADETTVEADETTGVTEADAVEKSTTITTGIVQNARTQISHSGTNATDAENLVLVAEAVVEAMTAEVAGTIEVGAVTAVTKAETDKVDALREEEAVVTKTVAMAIGTVPNVRILILPSEQNATDAVHHVVEAEGVDLAETLENERLNAIPMIDLLEESFQNDPREERVIDLHAEMDATAALNGEVRIEIRTIKIALEAMIDQRNANHVNLEPSGNHEETVRAMPTTDLLNH
ncbi:hypothetical protein OAP41_03230 [Candidatus Poseidoniaceae archaeon]|nr:hypothetical protein [Candidatus Poseidoniaceae archaeon]